MFRKWGTRQRAIFSSIIVAALFFIVFSPITAYVLETILAPSAPKNVQVIQKSREVALEWDLNSEYDIGGYKISVNGIEQSSVTLDKGVDNYIITNLENGVEYTINLVSFDNTNINSTNLAISVIPSDKNSSFAFNSDENQNSQNLIFGVSGVILIIIFFLTNWILFFKVRGLDNIFTIGLYPSISLFSYTILIGSILTSINSPFNKLVLVSGASIMLGVVAYIVFLTTNILHGAMKAHIPLEQAAKASQFIISLLSSYLILIYAFGINSTILVKFCIILPFIFYFTYSGIWILKSIPRVQILTKSLAITSLMLFGLVVLAIWPINIIYTILATSVIYYILLNVALEYRTKLNFRFWLEYLVLIILVTILLFTTAIWGINGTII